MTERETDCPGLRERKRRETRLRIEDCATELILDRGFHDVTLEEICEKAGVSRRTFFNYFNSKDEVAAGTGVPPLSQDDLDTFATNDSDNVVRDILRYIGDCIDSDPDRSLRYSPDRETSMRIRARRRRIVNETPELMISGMRRFDQLAGSVLDTIRRQLTGFPDNRKATDLTVDQEALLLTSVIRQVLVAGPLVYGTEDDTRTETLNRTGRHLTRLAAAYSDGWD